MGWDGDTVKRAIDVATASLVQNYGRADRLVVLLTRANYTRLRDDTFAARFGLPVPGGTTPEDNWSMSYHTAFGTAHIIGDDRLSCSDRVIAMDTEGSDASLCPPMVAVPLGTVKASLREPFKPALVSKEREPAPKDGESSAQFARRMRALRSGRTRKKSEFVSSLAGPEYKSSTLSPNALERAARMFMEGGSKPGSRMVITSTPRHGKSAFWRAMQKMAAEGPKPWIAPQATRKDNDD